jgi:hypothetical protein
MINFGLGKWRFWSAAAVCAGPIHDAGCGSPGAGLFTQRRDAAAISYDMVAAAKTEVIGLARRICTEKRPDGQETQECLTLLPRPKEAVAMARKARAKRKRATKTILKLPDLEQSKSAVLNSLTSPSSQRSYDHAIREFIDRYCSEPRLAFNKTVVTRYRISLEQRHYAPSTINLRLAAVRRLAYEASDCGLLSPDLAAGIRRVKGARRAGANLRSRDRLAVHRKLLRAGWAQLSKVGLHHIDHLIGRVRLLRIRSPLWVKHVMPDVAFQEFSH